MSFMDPLLELQDIDAQIYELEKEIKDIPARKDAELAKLNAAKSSLVDAQKELQAAKSNADSLELQARASQESAEKLKDQQSGLKSVKSLEASSSQIAAFEKRKSEFENEHISAIEASDEAEKRVADAQTFVESESTEIAEYIKELDERLAEAKDRLADLLAQRKDAAAKVFPQHLVIYERLRKSRKPTVVPLRDGVCGGCHLTQPPAIEHLVHRLDYIPVGDKRASLVACTMCGRLLYTEK